MPKAPQHRRCTKFYAVRSGRHGPQIYGTFEEFRAATANYSGYSAKGFATRAAAQAWLDEGLLRTSTAVAARQKRTHDFDHDMNDHEMTDSTMPMILGSSQPSARPRSQTRHRYSYPASATEWTEYTSPLFDAKDEFVIDVVSDRSRQSAPPRNEPWDLSQDLSMEPVSVTTAIIVPNNNTSVVNEAPPDVPVIKLSAEQQHVLNLVRSGKNVFFTGPAGTGKSVLLREIIKLLKDSLPDRVAITASTGIAGLNIGGSTVHSFAGIGLGKESAKALAIRISKSKFPRQRWRNTSTLIIDEISMLDGMLFDKLEYIARYVRECEQPFGGIQLVLSGDFFQLPPVPDQNNGVPMPATYAFDADCWQRCVGRPIVLSRVFRQKDDEFVDMLSSMRLGQLTPQLIERFKQLSRSLIYEDGIEASVLFPLRAEVEGHNNSRLNVLTGDTHIYHSMDSRGYNPKGEQIDKDIAQRLLERLVAPRSITLKVGAQVMLIKNIVKGLLVNGVVGKVTEFLTNSEALKRNIAIATIDKKGGRVHVDGDEEPRRCDLVPLTGDIFRKDQFWPLVRFTNGMELLCAPVDFSVEGLVGNVEAYRLQVPLILAWALSIHKSQGQTLQRVKVDLGRIFEKGQAYVALSRATSMETLEVVNFEPSRILAHPRVIAWQETWMTNNKPQPLEPQAMGASPDDEMDCEEAINRSHSLWDLSRCAEALPS